jgi:hypothetical protein
MATLEGWLNTSKEKSSVWVKPTNDNGAITDSVFVNLESKDATELLVTILRQAFAKKVSYKVMVDVENIKRSKGGSLFVKSTLAEVLDSMEETTRGESEPIAPQALSKAQAILNDLASREVATEATASDDTFLSF